MLKLLNIKINFEKDQNLFIILEKISRAESLMEFLLQIPYDLSNYKLRLPKDICFKYNLTMMNIWERRDGIPKEEFFDAVLELASFARRDVLGARVLSEGGELEDFLGNENKNENEKNVSNEKKNGNDFSNEKNILNENVNNFLDEKNIDSVYLYLMAAPIGHFLERLEKADFNVFEPGLHRPSRFVVPYRMFKILRKKEIILNF